ncbi:MAG: KTSC domain-containing protein [Sphingomonadaceae bacterium]
MKRQRVESSNLRSVGYDEAQQILEIEFWSGGVYRYYGVPPEVYRELLEASSKGRYFLSKIRNEYRYARAA